MSESIPRSFPCGSKFSTCWIRGQQGNVERLLEALVDVGPVHRDLRAVVRQQGDHDGVGILRITAEVLTDLLGIDPADRVVHHDAIGMEALGLNASLETAGRHLNLERLFDRQLLLEILDQDLILPDEQHLRHGLVFEVAQRHAVLFQELDQVLPRDAAILAARNAVALEPTRIEPFAHRAGSNFTDLGDLACCENLHHLDSMWIIRVRNCPGQPAPF